MPSLRSRRFFYYLYLLLFLITAPTVVLYTAGYRFDFRTQSLVRTGALDISTSPRSAHITLNENQKLGRTPDVLKNLIPGTYQLLLRKDGYHDWQREVRIQSRQTTSVENVVLFLESEPQGLFFADGLLFAGAGSEAGTFQYVTSNGSWFEVWEQNVERATEELVDRVSSATSLSPDEVLHLAQREDETSYTFVELDGVVALQKEETIAILSDGEYRVVEEREGRLLLEETTQSRVVLIDTNTNGAPILLNTSATFFHWDNDGIVYGDGIEVHRFDTATNTDALLTRSGYFILDALLINAQTYLFIFENEIVATDIADPVHPVTTTLFSADNIETAWLSEQKKELVVLATLPTGRGVYTLELSK